MLNCVSCVPCVVYVFTCQRAKSVPTFHFKCQRANKRAKGVPIFQLGVPEYQTAQQFFNFSCQKAYQFFKFFSNEYFNLWIFQLYLTFTNFENIWVILESLSRKTRNLNFGICKISLRKCKSNSVVVKV